jgi:hypothetical protein
VAGAEAVGITGSLDEENGEEEVKIYRLRRHKRP